MYLARISGRQVTGRANAKIRQQGNLQERFTYDSKKEGLLMFSNGKEYSQEALLMDQMKRFKLTGGRRAKSKALVQNIRKEQTQVLQSLTGRLKSIGAQETI